MTSPAWRGRASGMRLFLLASAVVTIVALVVAARRFATPGEAAPAPTSARAGVLTMPDEPIPAEADVFRTSRAVLAIPPDSEARRPAHPRTLETFRALRAFPGAPPRIPHGLTPKEFQTGDCNTCHQRGGYSQRFGAYVPITPHPDMGACLQWKRHRVREHESLAPDHESDRPGPLEHVHRRDLRHRLNEAIGRLPAMQQTCFRLCLVEGLSSAEAAGATGLAESTVRVHVFRARRALQEHLSGWRDEMEDA
jgi:RNA polymerase sigma factor (sigma-70 family)